MTRSLCLILRRAAVALAIPVLVLPPTLAVRAGTRATPPADAMGPRTTVSLPAFTGTFDRHQVLYLVLDTSSKAEARRDHLDYSPSLSRALPIANVMYLVMNGRFADRGPIFAYEPGEAGYTPLVQEVQVRWKAPGVAVAWSQTSRSPASSTAATSC